MVQYIGARRITVANRRKVRNWRDGTVMKVLVLQAADLVLWFLPGVMLSTEPGESPEHSQVRHRRFGPHLPKMMESDFSLRCFLFLGQTFKSIEVRMWIFTWVFSVLWLALSKGKMSPKKCQGSDLGGGTSWTCRKDVTRRICFPLFILPYPAVLRSGFFLYTQGSLLVRFSIPDVVLGIKPRWVMCKAHAFLPVLSLIPLEDFKKWSYRSRDSSSDRV